MTQRTKHRYYVRVAGPWACAAAVLAAVVDRAISHASASLPVSTPSPDYTNRLEKVESFAVDIDKRQRDGSAKMYELMLELKSDIGEIKGALGIKR